MYGQPLKVERRVNDADEIVNYIEYTNLSVKIEPEGYISFI